MFQLNDSEAEIIHEETGLIEDIAIDWTTGNVYFTLNAMDDTRLSHVAVIGKGGGNKVTLVTSNVNKPRGIALHPLEKLVLTQNMFYKKFLEFNAFCTYICIKYCCICI